MIAERRGGQPGPEPVGIERSKGQLQREVIRGAALDQLKATRPDMAGSSFALRWRDGQGRSHLAYNFTQTTDGPNGESRVVFRYNNPPTFESDYQPWYGGPAHVEGPEGEIRSGAFYTLYLDTGSRRGRRALKRFLRSADEDGYGVTNWFSTPRSGAVTQEGSPITSLTFLVQRGSREEGSTSTRA